MKILNITRLSLLLVIATPGCLSVNLDKMVTHNQKLPLPDRVSDNWSQVITDLPGLRRSLKPGVTNALKTFRIPTGSNSFNIVTVQYEDLHVANIFDPGNAVRTIISKCDSILHSKTGASANIGRTDLIEFLNLIDQLRSTEKGDLRTNLFSHIRELLEDQLQTDAIQGSTNLNIKVSLDALVATYLKAYLDGTFVDRWGLPLSQPDLSKLGNDSVVPFTKVMLEAVFDYSLMTPIVYDPNQSSTNKTPTFAVIFPQLYEKVSADSDALGITKSEYEAMKYLIQSDGVINKDLSSLITRLLGGVSVGAKISTGDNNTLSEIISALAEELSSRTMEHLAYNLFENFEYYSDSSKPWGYSPNFEANTNYFFERSTNIQTAIVVLLATQDSLKALASGGWKLTTNNIVDYETLADNLLDTNNPALKFADSNVLDAAIAIAKNKGHLNSNDQESLVNALNHLLSQTNLFDLASFEKSAKAVTLNSQNPKGIDLVRLNRLILQEAFPKAIVQNTSK